MSKKRVMIVDDEHITRHTLEALLQQEGYDLFFADSGQEALNQVGEIKPDVILLDVMMPNINGFEVCRRIKANEDWRHIPIILVTALASKKDLARGIDAGADDFLSKPVSSLELSARVRSMMRIKSQYDQLEAQKLDLEKTLELREELTRFNAQRLEELEVLHKIGLNLMNSLDADYIVELIAETVLKLIPHSDHCLVHFLTEDEEHLQATLFARNEDDEQPHLALSYDDIVRNAIDMRDTVYISDVTADEQFHDLNLPNTGTLLVVPLVVDGRPIGTLSIDSNTVTEFEVARRRLLSILASQLATSIMKARLFDALGGNPDQIHPQQSSKVDTTPLDSNPIPSI